jgi:hypothetical protein
MCSLLPSESFITSPITPGNQVDCVILSSEIHVSYLDRSAIPAVIVVLLVLVDVPLSPRSM